LLPVVLLVSLVIPALIVQPALPYPLQDQASVQTRDTITITGKVYDASARTPPAQANVAAKGSRLGTISDHHGSFHLTLAQPLPFTIVVSRLGYKSQPIEIMIRGFHQEEGSVFLKLMKDGLPVQDGNAGGPMGKAWRYNIGGLYRNDQGILTPGWTANRGGQVKANVTRLFEAEMDCDTVAWEDSACVKTH
jgi:hypothetical protein